MNIRRKWRLKRANNLDEWFWEYKGLFGPYATAIQFGDFAYWIIYTDYGDEVYNGVTRDIVSAKAMAEVRLKEL